MPALSISLNQYFDCARKEIMNTNYNLPNFINLSSQYGTSALRLFLLKNMDKSQIDFNDIINVKAEIEYLIKAFENIGLDDELEYQFVDKKVKLSRLLEDEKMVDFYQELFDLAKIMIEAGQVSKKHATTFLVFLNIILPNLASFLALKIQLKNPIDYYSWDL